MSRTISSYSWPLGGLWGRGAVLWTRCTSKSKKRVCTMTMLPRANRVHRRLFAQSLPGLDAVRGEPEVREVSSREVQPKAAGCGVGRGRATRGEDKGCPPPVSGEGDRASWQVGRKILDACGSQSGRHDLDTQEQPRTGGCKLDPMVLVCSSKGGRPRCTPSHLDLNFYSTKSPTTGFA